MKFLAAALFFCALYTSYAQDTDVFTKAPPEVDQALRDRILMFYKAHISGKYRDAFAVVADDAQDDFLAAGKNTYKSCEITKINYTEDFTKASAVVACKGEYRWRGERMPATIPLTTDWKLVDGQWFWYVLKRDLVATPFGLSRVSNDDGSEAKSLPVHADPASAVREIFNKVSVDKTQIELKGYENSQDEVRIANNMPGAIHVSVNCPGTPGLAIKIEKHEIPAGEKGSILFSFSVDDAKALCHDCFKPIKPSLQADVRIEPTGQVFPVTVKFAIPPELQKLIPAELQKAQPAAKP